MTGVSEAAQHARMHVTYVQETNSSYVCTAAASTNLDWFAARAHRSEAPFGSYSWAPVGCHLGFTASFATARAPESEPGQHAASTTPAAGVPTSPALQRASLRPGCRPLPASRWLPAANLPGIPSTSACRPVFLCCSSGPEWRRTGHRTRLPDTTPSGRARRPSASWLPWNQ